MKAPFRHTVLFDEGCPICRASVEGLRRWDVEGRLEFLPNTHPSVGQRFSEISPGSLSTALHLVSPQGRVWKGADAVEAILGLLPGFSWMSFLFRIPFARPLARRVYGWVARNRRLIPCREHCGASAMPDA